MPERVPCPICAELIMPGAKKCHFCGHWLSRAPEPARADASIESIPRRTDKALNVPAIAGLPLALLAWPVCGLFFLIIFKQLIQSLMLGAVAAAAGLGCGAAGIILASRKRKKTGGMVISIASAVIGCLALLSLVSGIFLARVAAEQLPDSLSPIKEILGTEAPEPVPMKCAECGHEFEVSTLDLIRQMAGQGLNVIKGVNDINSLLDEVEKAGAQGHVCPQCGKPAAQPTGQFLQGYNPEEPE